MKPTFLTQREQELIEKLRTGKYHSIKVRCEEGAICGLELERRFEPSTPFHKILRLGAFLDLTVKQHHGRVSFIQATEKIRFFEDSENPSMTFP